MTVAVQAPPTNDATTVNSLFHISVNRYHRMIDADIFTKDDAVELLEGWIVNKMPKTRLHTIVTNLVRQVLELLIGTQHHVESESAITLVSSEPEPDVMIVRGQLLDYTEHPTAADVSLLVEVSHSSLRRDQNRKKQIYAVANIPIYWIINLNDRQIEVYTDPSGSTQNPNYYQLHTYRAGENVPVVVDGNEIGQVPVSNLLP